MGTQWDAFEQVGGSLLTKTTSLRGHVDFCGMYLNIGATDTLSAILQLSLTHRTLDQLFHQSA